MFELDEHRRDELIERWATALVGRGLAAPAVFLLEAHKPVASLGAHGVLAFGPMLRLFVALDAEELAAFLYRPENLDRLIQRIEELNTARSARPPREHGGTDPRATDSAEMHD